MGKPSKSDNELLQEINEKLEKLLGIIATQGKDLDSQIAIFRSIGWEWEEIGRFTGMKADAVRMRYSRKK